MSVFGSVISGIRSIHLAKACHGDLMNGDVIKNINGNLKGVLYNMIQHSSSHIPSPQLEDINNLLQLMRWVLLYPFDGSRASPVLERM